MCDEFVKLTLPAGLAAVADAVRTSLGPKGMDKMVSKLAPPCSGDVLQAP